MIVLIEGLGCSFLIEGITGILDRGGGGEMTAGGEGCCGNKLK